jgi:DNA invertase Pin-like site-specific DNA recombinase
MQDTLVITELSRMSRSTGNCKDTGRKTSGTGVFARKYRHVHGDRCFLAMMGAVSQMEREIKAERAEAGRAAAKARGKTGGRPRTDTDKLEQARILYQNSDKSAKQVCQLFGFSRRTLFNYIQNTQKQTVENAVC